MLGEALMTAAISASTRASAVMRSRSRASRTTMSPGPTRRRSRSMSRSTRAVPVMPGLGLAVRESSADIFISAILSANPQLEVEARRNTSLTSSLLSHRSHARRLFPVLLGGPQEFAGMRPAAVGVPQPREHAGEFGDPALVVEPTDAAGVVGAGTVDDEMNVGVGGDLRKVRDDDDLMSARQSSQ